MFRSARVGRGGDRRPVQRADLRGLVAPAEIGTTMRNQLHDLLREQADLRGDAPAVTYRDSTLGYASCTTRAGHSRPGCRGGPRPRRPRRDLARQAGRDGRVDLRGVGGGRRLRAGEPGAQAGPGLLHPRRLRRPCAHHDPPAVGAAPRRAEELGGAPCVVLVDGRRPARGDGRRGGPARLRRRRGSGPDGPSGQAASTSTWPPSSTRPAAPAVPRASSSATATCWWARSR